MNNEPNRLKYISIGIVLGTIMTIALIILAAYIRYQKSPQLDIEIIDCTRVVK